MVCPCNLLNSNLHSESKVETISVPTCHLTSYSIASCQRFTSCERPHKKVREVFEIPSCVKERGQWDWRECKFIFCLMLRFLILLYETSCRELNDTCIFDFGSFLISHSLYKYLILKRSTLHKICSCVYVMWSTVKLHVPYFPGHKTHQDFRGCIYVGGINAHLKGRLSSTLQHNGSAVCKFY